MKEELLLADVKVTYYNVVNGTKNKGEKRYRKLEDARAEAEKTNGEVVRVTKRMKETIEFEPLKLLVTN